MNICNNCNSEFQGNFCSNCGHPKKLQRIDGHYILSEIASVFNFHKGIFYTIKELLIRPGRSVKTFISEDRNRLVKPIMFLIVASLVYTLFIEIFHFKDGYINYNSEDQPDSGIGMIFQWICGHYGYSNIIMALFIAIWIKVLFRKYNYNFYEILILLCFIMGIGMLMLALFGAMESILKINFLEYGLYIFFIYAFWAIGQFFDKSRIINYGKAFIAYFAGVITFILVSLVIGFLIDLMK